MEYRHTDITIAPQEQHIRESSKVGREEEGLSSNRPELVALRECLEAHEDHVNLLYLTDSEVSLQAIHKWIDCGAKLNLSKSPDADILFKTSKKSGSNSVNQGQEPQGGLLE
jgi:hypothetical protein